MTKFIFITGGVVSSLGKGIAASSIATLLQARGFKVKLRKLDPYLNVDPGTMSPFQHGEVFVTDDGAETDLDLGHYERFLGIDAQKTDSTTTGKIYSNVIERERRGGYLGNTVQVVPHIIDEIKNFIFAGTEQLDFVICEIGGTVGDIESLPYLEAIRQVAYDIGRNNVLYVHLTLLPYLSRVGEIKTKPTQHSVKELLNSGIQPNILLCRSERYLSQDIKTKIALFCNVIADNVISAVDVNNIYEIPLSYYKENIDKQICQYFNLPITAGIDLSKWQHIEELIKNTKHQITIAIVAKYSKLQDAYKSLLEAINHACFTQLTKPIIKWIDAEHDDVINELSDKDITGIIVPGGFGHRGVEGKIEAIRFARENNIPYFGICLGMQLATIEIARNLAGIKDAHSTEFSDTKNPVIDLMYEWKQGDIKHRRVRTNGDGGTMRLGSYPCLLDKNSLAYKIYGQELIHERHRHRYEFNTNYKDILEKNNFKIVGMAPDTQLPEMVEYEKHPWFIGVQFHPEFKSKPFTPHPLFVDFIKHNLLRKNQ